MFSNEVSFAAVELAWTSFSSTSKKVTCSTVKNGRIHPTQKPVQLYEWILQTYSSPGQRILDTHLGSGSIAVACHYFGAYLTASEIDVDYFNAAKKRIEQDTQQLSLFLDCDKSDFFATAEVMK
jgi:site-specific DNA-methyltransferase (adenine-specific)